MVVHMQDDKRKYIIDTSAFRPPTQGKKRLVINRRGEPVIEDDARSFLSQHSIRLVEIDNFTKSHDVIFLSEVIAENEGFIKYLLGQKEFLERLKLQEDPQEFGQRLAFARNIGNYAKQLSAFNAYFAKRAFDVQDLEGLQRRFYGNALDKAVKLHNVFDANTLGPSFGTNIDTDRKLIATVLATSLRYSVTFISRDERIVGEMEKGQRGSLEKVIESLKLSERKEMKGFKVDPCEIRVYNPKHSDNGFYDADKERVVYERANVRKVR